MLSGEVSFDLAQSSPEWVTLHVEHPGVSSHLSFNKLSTCRVCLIPGDVLREEFENASLGRSITVERFSNIW